MIDLLDPETSAKLDAIVDSDRDDEAAIAAIIALGADPRFASEFLIVARHGTYDDVEEE